MWDVTSIAACSSQKEKWIFGVFDHKNVTDKQLCWVILKVYMALYAATSCGLCHMACEPGSYMQILPQFIPLTSNRFQHKSVFVSQWWWFSSESVSLELALMLELTRFFLVCNLYFYYFFHLILIRVGFLLSTGALRTYCSGLWRTKRCLICHNHI